MCGVPRISGLFALRTDGPPIDSCVFVCWIARKVLSVKFIYHVIVILLLSSFAVSTLATFVFLIGYAAYGVYPLSAFLEGFFVIPSLLLIPLELKSMTVVYYVGSAYWLVLILAFLILRRRIKGP